MRLGLQPGMRVRVHADATVRALRYHTGTIQRVTPDPITGGWLLWIVFHLVPRSGFSRLVQVTAGLSSYDVRLA